jgi:hypothetical protein
MKVWDAVVFIGALVVVSFVAVVAVIYLQHDLRGWSPNDRHDPATIVEPTLPGKPAFAIAECLPGTVWPYEGPSAEEYSGAATVAVLTCRSRSSAIAIGLAYLVLAIASLVLLCVVHRARSNARSDSEGQAS